MNDVTVAWAMLSILTVSLASYLISRWAELLLRAITDTRDDVMRARYEALEARYRLEDLTRRLEDAGVIPPSLSLEFGEEIDPAERDDVPQPE